MAEPARVSADEPGPDEAKPRRSDPLSPGWVNVQRGMIANGTSMASSCQLMAVTATEAAARPGDPRLLELLGLAVEIARANGEIAREHGEIARRLVIDQSVLDAVRDAAYEQGFAACKAARCHLEAVPVPH